MGPWEVIESAIAPDGGELVLYRRGVELMIRDNGLELMSTRAHFSEEAFARLGIAAAPGASSVLIGGLGLGYTVLEAARLLPSGAEIVVAELLEPLVRWHQGPLEGLGALRDPRVGVIVGDVAEVIAANEARWDVVLLDVDNGPGAIMRSTNARLYQPEGLAEIRRALVTSRPSALAVWSASADDAFAERLFSAGFEVEVQAVPARGLAGDPEHTIFIARPRTG